MTDVVQVVVSGARGPAGFDQATPIGQRAGRFPQYTAAASGREVVAVEGATPANAVAATDLAAPTGAKLTGYGQGSVDEAIAKSASYFGIDMFATRDQTTALQTAMSSGMKVQAHPDANYRKDGPLMISGGTHWHGQGSTITALSDGHQCITISGAGVAVRDVRHLLAASARGDGDNANNGFTATGLTDFLLDGLEVGSVDPDGTATMRGAAGAGIMLYGCYRGRVVRPVVRYSYADAIHSTAGTSYVDFEQPYVYQSGDDGVAFVGYAGGLIPMYNRVFGGTVVEARARGFSAVGAHHIRFIAPQAFRTSAAAFYFAAEDGTYKTHGVRDAHVIRGYAEGCVTGVGLDPNFANAVGLAVGVDGTASDGTITWDRKVLDCSMQLHLAGIGKRAPTMLSYTSPFVTNFVGEVFGQDIIGTDFIPSGAQIGGFNSRLKIGARNLGGHLLDILAGAPLGVHRVELAGVDGIRTQADPIQCVVYTEGDPNALAIYLTGETLNAPATFLIDVGNYDAKIRKTALWHNAAEVTA